MFKLVIEDDEGNKTVVPVIRDEITIGRQEGNTIRLTERNVSRRHARLVREDDKVFLEEISARYGTKKNGERIEVRTDFGMGDVFSIGDYRLTLQTEGMDAKAPPPPKANGAAAPPPKPANPFADAPTQVTHRDEILGAKGGGTEILPAAPAKLVIVSSNFAGQEFPLKKKEMVIGRGDECDIIVDHRSVSTQHAKVVREQGGEYKIVDLNSKNGVKVSGEEYRNVHLKRGDVVELGHVKFRFVEPGENYVFTPQAIDDFAAPAQNKNTMIIGVVGVLVVVLAIVGAVVMMGGEETEGDGGQEDPFATKTTGASDPDPVQEDPVEEDPTPTEGNKADEAIAKAEDAFKKGRMQKAIETLNTVREFLDPTPEQVEKIEELLSKARMEKTPARDLEVGRDHLANERFSDALEAFQKIPPDTAPTVYAIVEDEGLIDKAIDGVLASATAAADAGEKSKAEELVNSVLAYDEENADASALLAELKKPAPKSNTRPKTSSKPKFQADPEEGRVLFQDATKAMLKGQWNDAISKCKLGLRHGENRCHRVLGISYKNTGDEAKACKHLKRIGASGHDGLVCD